MCPLECSGASPSRILKVLFTEAQLSSLAESGDGSSMWIMSNPSHMTSDLAGRLKVRIDSLVMRDVLLPLVMAAFGCGAFYDSHGAQAEVDCPCDNWREEHPEWIWCDDFEGKIHT